MGNTTSKSKGSDKKEEKQITHQAHDNNKPTPFPQTAEQKDTEIMDEQIANKKAFEIDTFVSNNKMAISGVDASQFQNEFGKAIENVQFLVKCDRETILSQIGADTDEEVITSELAAFTIEGAADAEYEEAIQHIDHQSNTLIQCSRAIGKIEPEIFINKVCKKLSEFKHNEITVEELKHVIDETVPEKEYQQAIKHVRQLGQMDQEIFANKICETYLELNNREITMEELKNIFTKIRDNFADEAKEEWMEANNNESDSDSDYDEYNQIDLEQLKRDTLLDTKQKNKIVFVDNESDPEFYSESASESLGDD